ncbi:MAG TPA: hypothetical protein VF120_10565 [Ktedonobacterales bacterium]
MEDITTGAVHIAWSLTSATLASWYFLLAPDGKHALFFNTPFRDYPYRPDMRLIDIATGDVAPLPAIAQALGQGPGIDSIVWRAGTMTLAASNGELQTWVIDVQHDEARLQPYRGVVEGWAPASDTLVLVSEPYQWAYEGTYMLTTVAGASTGSGTPTPLATGVQQLWFAGFARTAG